MKNIDFINKVQAEKLGISESIIKKVNKYYWDKGVRRKLSTLESLSVFIKGLGVITVSRYNLNKFIKKTIIKLKMIRLSDKYKEENKKIYIDTLEKRLKKLLIKRNELAILYYEQDNRIFETDTVGVEEL